MGSGVSVAAEIDDAYIQQQLKIAKRKIVVVGAAEEDANGIYSIIMENDEMILNDKQHMKNKKKKRNNDNIPSHPYIRNQAWIFRNSKGFQISREIIDDEAGWIIGKPPLAYYGTRNDSLLCPSCIFKGGGEFLGSKPFPSVFDDLDKEFSPAELPSLPIKVQSRMIPSPPKLDKHLINSNGDNDYDNNSSNSDDGDAGLDRADSFFAVSPVKQRNKAWSTPTNNPLPKGNLFDELADKENVVNQYKKRKTNRYEYYKKRLKKKTRTSGLKARANEINKPITPQRADPLDFI
jgi:hypothetical protein